MQSWSSLLFASIQIKNTCDMNQLEVKLVSFGSLAELRHQGRNTNTSETQEKNNLDKCKAVISTIYLNEMRNVIIKRKKSQSVFKPLSVCIIPSSLHFPGKMALSLQSHHDNRTPSGP